MRRKDVETIRAAQQGVALHFAIQIGAEAKTKGGSASSMTTLATNGMIN